MEDHLCVGIVEEDRYGEFMHLLLHDFFPRESVSIASGFVENLTAGSLTFFEQFLAEGISLAVIDRRTDRIVAVALNHSVDRSRSHSHDDLPPKLKMMLTFLSHLEEGYDVFEQCRAQRGIELFCLCVQEGYGGRGIARKLTEETIALARKQPGVAFIQCNPTAPATGHLFRSLAFETVSEMRLVDYFIDGRPAFPYALPHHITRFDVKKL